MVARYILPRIPVRSRRERRGSGGDPVSSAGKGWRGDFRAGTIGRNLGWGFPEEEKEGWKRRRKCGAEKEEADDAGGGSVKR